MPFFQGFTLDTLLGSVSCLLGAAALFFGGKAYRNCKIINSSLNDRKEFNDSSSDHSQRAVGDIINNNCDVTALAKVTTDNFEICLKQAYSMFEQQSKTNLQQIIEKTNHIIQEQKPNIAGLTKIDWINIYFECAKNISDEYMQNVWAKVLERELETPGSFGYKTLDILKNMSADSFRLFEKMLLLQVEGVVLQKEVESNKHIQWIELQILREHGLINLESSKRTYSIEAHDIKLVLIGTKYVIKLKNDRDEDASFSITCYLLSTAAKEIMNVLSIDYSIEHASSYASFIMEAAKSVTGVSVSLHAVNEITAIPDQPGKYNINYNTEDLIK